MVDIKGVRPSAPWGGEQQGPRPIRGESERKFGVGSGEPSEPPDPKDIPDPEPGKTKEWLQKVKSWIDWCHQQKVPPDKPFNMKIPLFLNALNEKVQKYQNQMRNDIPDNHKKEFDQVVQKIEQVNAKMQHAATLVDDQGNVKPDKKHDFERDIRDSWYKYDAIERDIEILFPS